MKNNKVLIITIQKLVSIKKKNPEHFEKLKNQINFIMFDEGHREPALESC
ncbi:DEAD/DEAH box helicase family protein [Peribacillus sp. V2I11]